MMKKLLVRILGEKRGNRFFNFWFAKDNKLGAAALTYYSISGIVPLCILIQCVKDFFKADVSISDVLVKLFPYMCDSVKMLNQLSDLREYLFSWWGLLLVILVLIQAESFFENIQRTFNNIWKSGDRENIAFFSVKICFVFVISLIFYAKAFDYFTSRLLCYVLTFFYLALLSCSAFWFVPYDKKPALRPVLISGTSCAAALIIWFLLIPYAAGWLANAQERFLGIEILLLVFWLFYAWRIVIFSARFCSFLDKSESYYLSQQVDELAPVYKIYLSILSAAFIFSHPKNSKDLRGLSFDEIRKGMLLCSEEVSSEDDNKKAFLPMSMLNSIITILLKRKIIQISPERTAEPRYETHKDIDPSTYTVGEMLFNICFSGSYGLRYYYMNVCQPLWEKLTDDLISCFFPHTDLVRDIRPDILLKKHMISDLESSSIFNEFKKNFNHDMSKEKLKDDYEHLLTFVSMETLIDQINGFPESSFKGITKNEHIQIVRSLSHSTHPTDKTDINDNVSETPLRQFIIRIQKWLKKE